MNQPTSTFRFKEFRVYQDAREFHKQLKTLIKQSYPKEEQYGLTQQLRRTLDSLVLNIAEGSHMNTDKHFKQFLNIALGSLNEIAAALDVSLDDGYITTQQHQELTQNAESIFKQLRAFSSRLQTNLKK